MRLRSIAAVLSVPLFALACGGASNPPPASEPGAPAPPPAATPTLPAPLDAAVTRVRALIDLPDPRSIDDAFTAEFLKQVPADKVVAVFLQFHGVAPCTLQSVISTDSKTSGKVHLGCRTGGVDVTISVEPAPPYKMTLLIVKAST